MTTPQQATDVPKFKMVVIGDETIGKTCLLISYRSDSSQSLPSVFSSIDITKTISRNNTEQPVTITLCDSSPDPINKSFRVQSYRHCDICLACFDIQQLNSLQSIASKWIPEIKQYAPHSLILLVGLKGDLRGTSHAISLQQIEELRKNQNIVHYIETSALKKTNVDEAFQFGIVQCLDGKHGGYGHREARHSTVSNIDMDQDCTAMSLNTVMNIHQKQWKHHVKSLCLDSNDTDALTEIRPSAAGAMNTAYNTWQPHAVVTQKEETPPIDIRIKNDSDIDYMLMHEEHRRTKNKCCRCIVL
eukprot:136466_1